MTLRILRLVGGALLLVALDLAGRWTVAALHVPLPGSVLGMLVLTVLIETKVLPMAAVRDAADLLVRHLALLYVPAGAAIIGYASAVRGGLLAVTVAALASLVAVLLVVGVIVHRFGGDA